jgi:hypothetical protein
LEVWRKIGELVEYMEEWRIMLFHGSFLEYVGAYGKKWNCVNTC